MFNFIKNIIMKKQVIIQFEIEGFHHYPDAPEQVKFLSDSHRHTFKVKAGYEVEDSNREKEIFIERDYIKQYLTESFGYPCQFGAMSCEMIAEEILEYAQPEQMIWCEVWEEETGGARVEI
jgi:hypothetical protein